MARTATAMRTCSVRPSSPRSGTPLGSPTIRLSATQQQIRTVLAIAPCTVETLQDVTGFTYGSVVSAIVRLREHGLIEAQARIPKKGSGAAVCVYAITPEAA